VPPAGGPARPDDAEQAPAGPLPADLLQAELAAALALNQQGRPGRARSAYRRLLTRIDRLDRLDQLDQHGGGGSLVQVRVRGLLGLATTGFDVDGDLPAALDLLDRAERLATGPGPLPAAVRGQRGLLLLRAGRLAEAGAALDRAHRLLAHAEPLDRCAILLNRGVVRLELSAHAGARADFAACAQAARAAGDALMEFKARHNLGYVEFLVGNLPAALAQMADAAAVDPQGPRPIALLDQARVLLDAGLADEADATLARAGTLFAAERAHSDLAESLVARAEVAQLTGRWQDARGYLRPAIRAFDRRGNEPWLRRAQVLDLKSRLNLSVEQQGRGAHVLAAEAGGLAASCDRAGRRELARAARLVQAEASLATGEPVDAASLPRVSPREPLAARLATRRVRALAALHDRQLSTVRAQVRAGWRDLAERRSQLGSWDLRTATAAHGAALAGLDVTASATGGPAAVFAAVERWRALNAQVPSVAAPADPQAAEALARLRALALDRAAVADDPAAGGRLAALDRQRDRLQAQLRQLSWQAAGGRAPVEPALLPRWRAALADRGLCGVCLFEHDGQLGAVLVAPGRAARLVRLGPAAPVRELARRVRADLETLAVPRLPAPIAAVARASLDRGLIGLDHRLLEPLGPVERPVVLLPPQELAALPWGLLPSRRGRATTVAPSATNWLRADAAGESVPVGAGSAVAVAGPGLAGAVPEAAAVASCWPAAPAVTGAAATSAAALAALARVRLVHLAAHGRHEPQSPLFSTLRLADGPLFAHELDLHGVAAPVVLLSACELGLATVRPGDQALGWTAVLLDRGARSVTASVAEVADQTAARVMVDVHRRLRAGADTAAALGAACGQAWDDGLPAPFVCFGAGVAVDVAA